MEIFNMPFNKRKMDKRTNVDALIGQRGIVIEKIDYAASTGRVKLGGEEWRAVTEDESSIDVGDRVVVHKIIGNRVIVKVIK
jgi:membrane protein implicated in regulation of membrane protease activity